MKKISVIIPTYKPQGYLWECLDSLCSQTLPRADVEVLLVLNGCREPYEEQIREYLAAHPELPVRFMHTDEAGVSHARNLGLDAAQGEYVAFIDDDDYVSPTYLEELYALASPQTIALCYPYEFRDGQLEAPLPHNITKAYDRLAAKGQQPFSRACIFFSGPCRKLIPMSAIGGRRFDTSFRHGEDGLFMFLISDAFQDVAFTSPQAVYFRRYRENSALTCRKSAGYIIKNALRLAGAFSAIYFSAPLRYNLRFYLYKVCAALYATRWYLKNN